MKKFIALAVLATATASFAASDIYDIQYLPAAGTTYGFTTAQKLDATLEYSGGEDEISGYAVTQTIGHSFSDRLSLQASLSYANLEYDEDGGDTTDYASGISDPSVQARFRLMDESFRWDIVGGAILSLQDKEVKSNGDQNNVQGGHSLLVGTQFGGKSESFQWSILGVLTHNLEAETEFKGTGGGKIKDDANNELLVRADILNKLAEKSLLRSHVSVDMSEGYEDDQDPAGETAAATLTEIGTEYQHLMSQDLLLRVGVDYGMQSQRSGQIDDITLWTWTVGANYQF